MDQGQQRGQGPRPQQTMNGGTMHTVRLPVGPGPGPTRRTAAPTNNFNFPPHAGSPTTVDVLAPDTQVPGTATTAQPTPNASSVASPEPSATVRVNGTTTTPSLPRVPAGFLTSEFMQSVASTLDDFDNGLFETDSGINFEDFREWFDADEVDVQRERVVNGWGSEGGT